MMIDFESIIDIPTPQIEINEDIFIDKGVKVFVKRDDLTHEFISGNKFRKLKYNLIEAEKNGQKKLLTFGGAYSNHLSAFAYACNKLGFQAGIIVRGDELNPDSSPTLKFAHNHGAELIFVSRTDYRDKEKLAKKYGEGYLVIPEGGSNTQALPGMQELVLELGDFDVLFTACGTGGTFAGILKYSDKEIYGVSVLKGGDFIKENVENLLNASFPHHGHLLTSYHFGGYGKYDADLINFLLGFEKKHQIPIEQVYTAKAFFAFYDLLKKDHFKIGQKIVLLHTGGLQGRLSGLPEI